MKISFVIPAYNEEKYLPACLASLTASIARNEPLIESEVIVVDNASTDGTGRVAQNFPGVRVVREARKGLTFARQRGFEESEGDVIVYFDADTRVPAKWIPTMLKIFSRNRRAVAVSGPYFYFDFPFPLGSIASFIEATLGGFAHMLTGHCVAGGNFAVRRVALARIGGFDPDVEFYSSVDVAKRLKKIGKIIYSKKLPLQASARRFNAEGLFATLFFFVAHFLSVSVRGRPADIAHRDIR